MTPFPLFLNVPEVPQEVQVMSMNVNYEESITKKIQDLSPEQLEEVIDFIEFLKIKRMKKGHIDVSSLLLQQESVSRIWNSENEDLYEL